MLSHSRVIIYYLLDWQARRIEITRHNLHSKFKRKLEITLWAIAACTMNNLADCYCLSKLCQVILTTFKHNEWKHVQSLKSDDWAFDWLSSEIQEFKSKFYGTIVISHLKEIYLFSCCMHNEQFGKLLLFIQNIKSHPNNH